MPDILSNQETRDLMLDRVKVTYLGLNLYRQSELLDGVVSAQTFRMTELGVSDFRDLCTAHFLLCCLRANLPEILDYLQRNLGRSLEQVKDDAKGQIRGTIDWGSTIRKRADTGFSDPSLFVIRTSNKVYDTPSNRLLKFLLEHIRASLVKVDRLAPGAAAGWVQKVMALSDPVERSWRSVRLREVVKPARLEPNLVLAAENSRDKVYRTLGQLGRLFLELFAYRDPDALYDVVCEQLLAPMDSSNLFEFLVFFETISVLEETRRRVGGMRQVKLIRASDETEFIYRLSGGIEVTACYQHVPDFMAGDSKYLEILRSYGISCPRGRRPDVILTVSKDGTRITGVIEAKYSTARSYIGEGVQDVLAYISEFTSLLLSTPKALLVVWSGITSRPLDELSRDVWVTDFENLHGSIAAFVASLIQRMAGDPTPFSHAVVSRREPWRSVE